jgi:hypothetical protein
MRTVLLSLILIFLEVALVQGYPTLPGLTITGRFQPQQDGSLLFDWAASTIKCALLLLLMNSLLIPVFKGFFPCQQRFFRLIPPHFAG